MPEIILAMGIMLRLRAFTCSWVTGSVRKIVSFSISSPYKVFPPDRSINSRGGTVSEEGTKGWPQAPSRDGLEGDIENR
jgi:hypothetical protein